MNTEAARTVLDIVARDVPLIQMLEAVRGLRLPDWAIGAGAVRNLVWDRLFGSPEMPASDIDVLFFDPANTGTERERDIEATLATLQPGLPWSVRNQARMHLRNGDMPYSDTADVVAHWLETPTAVAVRLETDDSLTLIAPHGVGDLLAGRIRPTPRGRERIGAYRGRLSAKDWLRRWPGLTVEDVI